MKPALISQKAMSLQNELELLEGEITEDINNMMLEISQSADDAGLFLDRSEYMIEYFKDFKKKIDAKIKTIENAQAFVESELKKSIAAIGDLEGNNFIFKLQKTKDKVIINDEAKISELYLRTKVTHEPDKTAIHDALKAGHKVDGAELVHNYALKKTLNTKKIKDVTK
jgi:hypothetical protein